MGKKGALPYLMPESGLRAVFLNGQTSKAVVFRGIDAVSAGVFCCFLEKSLFKGRVLWYNDVRTCLPCFAIRTSRERQ